MVEPAHSGTLRRSVALLALPCGVVAFCGLVWWWLSLRGVSWAGTVGLVAAVGVGSTLAFAGAAKLVAMSSWRQQARSLGVPQLVVPLVPVLELVLGALLVVRVFVPMVPIMAGVVLVAFSAVLVRELLSGRRPTCACFGAWSSAPISSDDLLRNAGLIGLCILATLR